ncbi:methionine gamma-lyase [Peptoniphilus harei]|uniref:Methionine gamma-lyase family protein n=1 Tax=Peptoniphilus harei TaxID=54005 RepID=A0A943XZG2_9FIRM|nr:methionine gamma-lyase family protein [Peptoniphilus harei]MBS6534363.1 methionine gamma-lyase family protein [Peptoniphilus harei]MDU1641905.1 methionine gamma-lyase family protein [Peptoniphilus harei]MDU2373176.1 methionine gamma-lyase family protein [Peptoniphilus harei]MDU6743123.1 methionine gamma-lyase family protein [Peptoniphilus harei]QQE47305.1 methionine gamma-lyase family protein [Peptoniphilus harei]
MTVYDNLFKEKYNIDSKIIEFVNNIEEKLQDRFKEFSDIAQYNQVKILKAMQEEGLKATDFNWTTGYGYGDIGRDKVESIYTRIFNVEDSLVRSNIVSGTHAITLAIKSVLKPGDHFLSVTSTPYDTLQKVIGLRGDSPDALINSGYQYSEVPLVDNMIDVDSIKDYIQDNTSLVVMQRSTGYSNRRAFTVSELKEAVDEVKKINKDIKIFVDNCYGEFTELIEPSEIGIDIMAGSLIKNPGGGICYTGGYVAGKEELVERAANFLTAPGIGKDCGLTFGMTRQILQGLFMSPKIVEDAIRGATLFSRSFEELGFKTIPSSTDPRSDIVTAIELQKPEILEIFCKYIQFSSPVDSEFTPIPWDMPGYDDQVIMAAGDFIEGSSIELSADGPMREPYYVYFQGGLSYYHIKFSLINLLNALYKEGLIEI